MILQGDMTLGTLITFYALLGYLVTPVKNLIELQPVIQSGLVAAERMADILEMQPEETKGQDFDKDQPVGRWDISNLSFRYGSQDPVLDPVLVSERSRRCPSPSD